MDLNRRFWYVRWFFWSLDVWLAFSRKEWKRGPIKLQTEMNGNNLCQFIRTVFVWAPLAITAHVIVYALLLASVTVVPVQVFGLSGYVKTVVICCLAVGAIAGIVYLFRRYETQIEDRGERVVEATVETFQTAYQRVQSPRFFSVLWSYIVAVKQKVCPIVRFQD